jgi:hypothetical protein
VYNEARELYAVKVVNLLGSDGHTDKRLMYEIHLLQVSEQPLPDPSPSYVCLPIPFRLYIKG